MSSDARVDRSAIDARACRDAGLGRGGAAEVGGMDAER